MSDQTPQPVKFSLEFTTAIETYIAIYKKQGKKPSVAGFAQRIGTDEQTIWAWANKKKKDEQGNVTDQLARPKFHAAVKNLQALEQQEDEEKLNIKQELFCKLYASEKEFFGNGVQSYIAAYGIDVNKPGAYNSARSSAYDLLINPYILKRIDELLEVNGLNDAAVDKELAFVIMQKADLSSKTAAIREYNKLKKRVIKRIDHTTKGQPIYGGRAATTE